MLPNIGNDRCELGVLGCIPFMAASGGKKAMGFGTHGERDLNSSAAAMTCETTHCVLGLLATMALFPQQAGAKIFVEAVVLPLSQYFLDHVFRSLRMIMLGASQDITLGVPLLLRVTAKTRSIRCCACNLLQTCLQIPMIESKEDDCVAEQALRLVARLENRRCL